MPTTLAISHYVYLTKEERYRWFDGEELEVVGVSSPVWFHKGVSSEPAVEVFCKYRLLTNPDGIFIKHNAEGYEVTVPPKPPTTPEPLPPEIWNSLTPDQQEQWYEQNQAPPTLLNLLDIRDGGSQYLAFRQYSKVRKNRKILNVIHFMEIKDMDELLHTMT
jgi:hypothetical protein